MTTPAPHPTLAAPSVRHEGDTMTAQRLRDAARVLRERADDAHFATHNKWSTDGHQVVSGSGGWRLVATTSDIAEDDRLSSYIASVGPGVGLALADWLDATARDMDWWEDLNKRHGVMCSGCDNCDRCAEMSLAAPDGDAPALHALRIADLILGGAA